VARLDKRRIIGLLLCVSAVIVVAAGWAMARSNGGTSTDNAYIRGDVTSLAPKVPGYVTAVEVDDNQAVQARDVLFRIDDRDYRARLAQAAANVEAARARLTSVDAEIQLQQALVRQAEAQRQSNLAEMNLATKASDRRRQLVDIGFISRAQLDESDAAQSRAEAGVSAASAMAFDTAFNAIALLFVIAAPVLIGIKIGLSTYAKVRAARLLKTKESRDPCHATYTRETLINSSRDQRDKARL
jgi:membrane fusion protein, multidrug efflux system